MLSIRRKLISPLVAFVLGAGSMLAGPPLICNGYRIGNDTSLPWGDGLKNWNDPDRKYDTRNLANDTMKLLDSGKPLLTRMETLRRAAVYSGKDSSAGLELANRLLARALTAETKGENNSLALFDAGYFVESLKQMALVTKVTLVTGLDGFDLVKRSLPGLPDKLTAEYALGLMQPPWPNEHIQRAVAGAQEGSLLADNLRRHFNNQSLAEIKRQLSVKTASARK